MGILWDQFAKQAELFSFSLPRQFFFILIK